MLHSGTPAGQLSHRVKMDGILATRLAFVLLKSYAQHGRFPRGRAELLV